MEIKAQLIKPYTEEQRIEFIVEQNHRNGYEIVENETSLDAMGYTEEEKAKEKKESFLKDFFKVPDAVNGQDLYYRKSPKGYSSAVESINTAFNIVSTVGSLQAEVLTFYEEPDFTKEEECTEEWLVEHQVKNEKMTAEEFGVFYAKFITAWNTKEHE